MLTLKKGMAIGEVFVFIVAALTFALIMIFGYKAITDFLKKGEQVQFSQFKNDLDNSIRRIYTEFGAVRIEKFQTPTRYEQICFVDMDTPFNSGICPFDQTACDVWENSDGYESVEENVFLKPTAPVTIKVGRIKMEKGFLCIPLVDGLFELVMEGGGDHTSLSTRNE